MADIVVDSTPLDELVGANKARRLFYQNAVVCVAQKRPFPSTLLIGNSGCGKAQPLDAEIQTPTGPIKMGEVQVGTVIYSQGQPTVVTGVFPQGKKEVFRITFADGRSTECCDDHLWKVWDYKATNSKQTKCGKTTQWFWKICSLKEIRNRPKYKRSVKIPLFVPSVGKDIILPIDPYVMGVLLSEGDITLGNCNVTNTDEKILRRVLSELGLYGCNSYSKFIPEIYFKASLEQKLELIRGLMDGDGTVSCGGSISYSTSSKRLAEDFQKLFWSIGGICKITPKLSNFGTLNYNLLLRHPNPKTLFTLFRKQVKISDTYQYGGEVLKLEIESIESVGFKECQCIMVSDPSHLYVTDNWIVTHNTTLARAVSKMLNVKLLEVHGQTLSKDKAVMSHMIMALRNATERTHLFIDEIHQLAAKDQEALYPLMENKTVTIIGATTDPGKLLRPLQNRFTLTIQVEDYTVQECTELVLRYAKSKGCVIKPRAARIIAERCRGVPRVAKEHLDTALNKATFIGVGAAKLLGNEADEFVLITKQIVLLTYEDMEIDPIGLTKKELRILEALEKHKTLSLKSLCSITEVDEDQYLNFYEPYLLKIRFVEKTSTGRRLTSDGKQYLQSNIAGERILAR